MAVTVGRASYCERKINKEKERKKETEKRTYPYLSSRRGRERRVREREKGEDAVSLNQGFTHTTNLSLCPDSAQMDFFLAKSSSIHLFLCILNQIKFQ